MRNPLYIKRVIKSQIIESLFKGKVVILYGARQIGKTTLVREILKKHKSNVYISCDELQVQVDLKPTSHQYLKDYFGDVKLIVLDEAQKIKDIGVILKIMNDFYPDIQIIATGSSSFDLANSVGEPLVGRSREFYMSPLTYSEIKNSDIYNTNKLQILEENKSQNSTGDKSHTNQEIKDLIVYGNYPEVYTNKKERKDILKSFVNSNLYKDVLAYRGIKKPLVLVDLLKLLAYQIGNEVSYNEIAGILKIDKVTVENYITLLEQAFIIFRLRPYSVNQRNDIKRMRKIYFWDTGIRNAVIGDFSDIDKREDKGSLFENYFISELKKKYIYDKNDNELYFWRSKRGNEIDLLEINNENKTVIAYECKYKQSKAHPPKEWTDNFGETDFKIVNVDNIPTFI